MVNTLQAYHYHLPEELIAQYPITPRDRARLLVIDRHAGSMNEILFRELVDLLQEGDQLVFNNTKVIPARLQGRKETGGAVELILSEPLDSGCWSVLARPARKLQVGAKISFSSQLSGEVLEVRPEGVRIVRFLYSGDFYEVLAAHGLIPLPHYINRPQDPQIDPERYQTVYAQHRGAVAVPAAGIHFTPELLQQCKKKGVEMPEITLHVGLGTFRPVVVQDIRDHQMHEERYEIPEAAAKLINSSTKRRICIGTTTCRALESATGSDGRVMSGNGKTSLFIYSGYQFKSAQSLLTNFHAPGSSLLMLVSAFMGYELMKEAYQKAIKDRFRFFSYGDAMLIL